MGTVIRVARGAGDDTLANSDSSPNFDFLPQSLRGQCRSLIESYHALHGFGCLPNILWRAGLGPFIENHREFRQLLKRASMNRSAKKSSEGFTQIATTLLSLEILAGNFAGWSTLYPQAASLAKSILKRYAPSSGTRLMESYLYPPKYVSPAAIAALTLPWAQPREAANGSFECGDGFIGPAAVDGNEVTAGDE